MKSRVYQSRGLNFCRGRGKIDTRSAIKKYINKFGVRGIAITSVQKDNGLEIVRYLIIPIHFEISERGEHVGDIKREVRTLKE